jgi:hypothetical protein
LRLRGDALFDLSRHTVDLNGAPVWPAPALMGTFAAGLAVRIP